MAVLSPEATYEQFCEYVENHKGSKTQNELLELWEWREKLLGLRVITGAGKRSILPLDEQHLTLREREKKLIGEAKAQGRNIEKV